MSFETGTRLLVARFLSSAGEICHIAVEQRHGGYYHHHHPLLESGNVTSKAVTCSRIYAVLQSPRQHAIQMARDGMLGVSADPKSQNQNIPSAQAPSSSRKRGNNGALPRSQSLKNSESTIRDRALFSI